MANETADTTVAVVDERTGEAYELGEQLTVVGRKLQPGDPAPDFALDAFDADAGAIATVRLADSAGRVRLLNIINSLDTPVCHIETHRWDALPPRPAHRSSRYIRSAWISPSRRRAGRRRKARAIRLCPRTATRRSGATTACCSRSGALLQRAVFVIGADDRIPYAEYVPDQMAEPDYDAAIRAITYRT